MTVMRAIVMGLAVVACGKSGGGESAGSSTAVTGSAVPAPAAALAGTWTGSWVRTQGPTGGGELVLTMGATPTFKRGNTLCPPEETPASVSVAGDKVTIAVSTPEVTATYTGTRSGNEIAGELVTTCKLGTGHGTWKLTSK